MTQLRPSLSKEFESQLSIDLSLIMSLISFLGSMLLHVIVVWLYRRYKHRHPTIPLWCGLFCPRTPKETRTIGCSEAAPAYSAELKPVHIQATYYSTKVGTLTPAQSQQRNANNRLL